MSRFTLIVSGARDPIAQVLADVRECLNMTRRARGKAPRGLLQPIAQHARHIAVHGLPGKIRQACGPGDEFRDKPDKPLGWREWLIDTSKGWEPVATTLYMALREAVLRRQDEVWNHDGEKPNSNATLARRVAGAEVLAACYLAESYGGSEALCDLT